MRVFKALSDVTRVEIVRLLGKAPRNVTELTSLVGVSQPKVSRHLKILRDAGLLRDVRKGKWVWYELALPGEGEANSVAANALDSVFLGKELRSTRQEGEEVTRGAGEGASRVSRSGGRALKAQGNPVGESSAAHIVSVRDKAARKGGERGTGRARRKGRVHVDKESPEKRAEKESSKKKELEDFLL